MNCNVSCLTTVFIGLCAYIKTGLSCNLDCGIGYTCIMRRSTCVYPPCPHFPTCIPRHGNGMHSMNNIPRHEGRYNPGIRRHHSSLTASFLSNSGVLLPGTGPDQERPGQCPVATGSGPCITTCRSDGDCPIDEKCCGNGCGQTCRAIVNEVTEKPGTCSRSLESSMTHCEEECDTDIDCSGVKKCCKTACGFTCSDPCYYWLRPNQRSSRKSVIWKLPFICRT